ncbi:Predicted arabinose efflux permease, MFS family [Sphingomonas sp. YR710]|uniref:MFS transporter n=1 Tax=Sphingomonas sp. YR710 TaxID=1882773 RepID=UPI00088E1481|nr:MFS transporter [Sphingomonas sp. YR710]SDC82409.1 Predicted arabinose efflux permease, MFS family [Sphingomonas sp. YR710]
MNQRRITATVLACHFAGAFGAVGMPPFLALILMDIAPSADARLTGWLYIAPTACLAISAPFWGRLADRWGRKWLLMRAQIGLAASFLVAGWAESLPLFVAALCLQGLLGGTFSASNAYLAEALPREALARSLNLTQGTARLSLIVAPVAVGFLVDRHFAPQRVYLVLALLPLAATLLLLPLPARTGPQRGAPMASRPMPSPGHHLPRGIIMAGQTGFTLALIASFPFLLPYSMTTFGIGASTAGWIFGLPHIIYLLLCLPLGKRIRARDPAPWLALGCLTLAVTLLAQAFAPSLVVFAVARLAMGIGMTLSYVALNALIANVIDDHSAGSTFGWFDSGAKLATIAASVAAGQIILQAGMTSLLAASAGCAALTAALALTARRPVLSAPSIMTR